MSPFLEGSGSLEQLVPTIVEKIMTSAEYASFVAGMVDEAGASIADVMRAQSGERTTLSAKGELQHGLLPQYMGEKRKMSFDFSNHSNATNESTCGSISFMCSHFLFYLSFAQIIACISYP